MVTSAVAATRRLGGRGVLAAAGAAVAAAGLAVAAVLAFGGSAEDSARRGGSRANTATVVRGDLVVRETVSGTLGYGDEQTLVNRLGGTITRLPKPGTTVRRGQPLYDVDGKPGAFLMYGATPAWRTLHLKSADGVDVRQLEQNLVALGHDPNGEVEIDDDFTAETARMVKRWQKAQGLPQTGSVELGRVVFAPGARRVSSLNAAEGAPAAPGAAVMVTTSASRTVKIPLDAAKRPYVAVGDRVTVELPDGRTVRGRVSSIGRVARQTEDGAVIDVVVTLAKSAHVPDLDEAPVSVAIVKQVEKNVLLVPVTALLAQRGGGYAVERVRADGRRGLVTVVPGTYADGYVEIVRGKLHEGDRVVVPE